MKTIKSFKVFILAGLVFSAGLSGQATAALDISDRPLFLQAKVPPAFIMAMDNSGSMAFETLFPGMDGSPYWDASTSGTRCANNGTRVNCFFDTAGNIRTTGIGTVPKYDYVFPAAVRSSGVASASFKTVPPIRTFGFARSHEYNPSYFNPSTTYAPWLRANGTPYPLPRPENMSVDPRDTSPTSSIFGRINMTVNHRDRIDDADSSVALITTSSINLTANTTVLMQGWRIRKNSGATNLTCNATRLSDGATANLTFNNTDLTINADRVITGTCNAVRVTRPQGQDAPTNWEKSAVPYGAVLPAGTMYYATASCGGVGTEAVNRDVWVRLPRDTRLTANCSTNDNNGGGFGIEFFPATFYLKTSTPAPAGFRTTVVAEGQTGGRILARDACGDGCNMYAYEIKAANYTSTAAYNAAIQSFANWFHFYGNRERATIGALTQAMADADEMRVGFFKIWDFEAGTNEGNLSGADQNVAMRDMSNSSDRQALYNAITNLPSDARRGVGGGTPNNRAVNHLGKQFMRTDNGAPVKYACQINGGMLFTDGYGNAQLAPALGNIDGPSSGAPFPDGHSNTTSDIAFNYYVNNLRPDLTAGRVPVAGDCSLPDPDPSLDCNPNLHMNFFGITLGAKGDIYGINQVLTNDPWGNRASFNWPNAYGNGVIGEVDQLWHAALNTRGAYINAETPSDISQAMRDIISSINSRAAASGGTAASGTRREDGFLAYVPHFDSSGWTGNVKAHNLTSAGALGTLQWDARTRLDARPISDRKVYFVTDSGTVEEFKAGATLPAGTVAALNRAVTDLCSATMPCDRNDVIEYLRGDHSNEVRNGGPFRNRLITDSSTGTMLPSRIGDILGSQPEVLNKSSYGYSSLPSSMGGSSYNTFLTTTKKDRSQLIFVASNNGMLHAFNAQTGEEVWALIPNEVLTDGIDKVRTPSSAPAHFVGLAYPEYSHRYFFDGSPRQGDAYISGSWKTVLAAPLGAGGRSMVVLDVTNGGGDSIPKVITEVKSPEMGYGVDRPRIAPLKDGTWRVLFGNGYNSNAHGARLFSVNLASGALLSNTVGGPGGGTPENPNGMAPVAVADDDSDLRGDVVYAGDYKGNLWKFPVTNAGIQNAGATPLFQARDANGNVQHITGGIDTIMHPRHGQIVYFGTGRYFLTEDRSALSDPTVESFYGVWDGDGWTSAGNTTAATTTYTRANLVKQTLSNEMTADNKIVRRTSTNPLDWGSKKGWHLELATDGNAQGERFVGVPTVALGMVFFTTFLPNADSDACASSGTNWLNVMDATTGVGGLGVGTETEVGSYKLPDDSSGGGPVGTPPIVVTPPPPNCDPATDPNCQPPQPDEDGNVNPLGAPQCNNDLGILLATGIEVVSQITCGRQSWRQIQ